LNIKGFCRFYKHLYVGNSIKNERLVKWKLKHGAGQFGIFVITESEGGEGNQLEIMHCAFLKQKYYLRHPIMVYGIAGSYEEALELLIKISDEAANAQMAGDLAGFLSTMN